MHCGRFVSASEQLIIIKKNIHPFSYLPPSHCYVRTKSAHREQFYVAQNYPFSGDSRLKASVDEREVRPRREPVSQTRQQGREILKRTLKCWRLGVSLMTPSISFSVLNEILT